ncbi:hypothetical protein M011DRAFT_55653 [Sporormia fimetaria CBS 119925]|uniref:Uncharacterized protein n=1 Tax=Sporormia fimetaria CBS 119925 TaxID=1340428 RepID=A0A6A6V9M5_9PLEO|nr:hypothetical protein M011DRAFT_55653 [Sporormia fimetaria CBS 119925]
MPSNRSRTSLSRCHDRVAARGSLTQALGPRRAALARSQLNLRPPPSLPLSFHRPLRPPPLFSLPHSIAILLLPACELLPPNPPLALASTSVRLQVHSCAS